MAKKLKVGDRVRVVIEGVVGDLYGPKLVIDEDDSLNVTLDSGLDIFIETSDTLKGVDIEVIPEPMKDGLYYDPIDGQDFGQLSLVYKLEAGKWYDFMLDEVDPEPEQIARFVRLAPVKE